MTEKDKLPDDAVVQEHLEPGKYYLGLGIYGGSTTFGSQIKYTFKRGLSSKDKGGSLSAKEIRQYLRF